ncbi:Arf GTPase activating protein [Corchorus capsularis]|uniref:Arf GTPase activating protein n=1 Tax=Corchorus capsularis TaxID=210143 RepID=A0A1R3IW99_COCAP|nr:Arf GTPase activating protein [Corchorus capsularis]
MASRLMEDEKNERIIRGLLKQPENRRCINCNSLGPQYVCTNFWTFVCTTCSGIHREFTHRVKSVSMAKFTSQEVSALQEGGNQRAKEIYFKEWDPQRNSLPDSSNVDRLRDFIKHVYVDRRFSGERNYDKPPRGRMGDKEDSYDNRRTDGYRGGSRSPPYEDSYGRYSDRSSPGGRNDDRNSRYGYDERRSPGYDQDSRQYGDNRKSPARPEVVNDWRREDRFANGRKAEDRRISDGDPKLEGRSPDRPKDLESSSPPVVRPVREILGENVIPLRISEPPKANGGRTVDGPHTQQRTASSSSLGSTSGNPAEVKLETTVSLIDFDADPEPPAAPAVPQTQQTTVTQSIAQPPSSTNDNNWASFDFAPQTKVSKAPSNMNTLDVLSQLSIPTAVPSHVSGTSSVVSAGGQSTAQQFTPPVDGASTNQPWNLASSQHIQGPVSAVPAQTPQAVPQPVQEATSAPTETKESGRKELPADLFTFTYPAYPAAAPGWQTGPPRGMGFPMQYNTPVQMSAFPQTSKSINPFDLGGETPPVQNQVFPSMASLQGALPNMAPPAGLVRTSSLGPPSSAWMPPQSMPYASGMPPQSLPYASGMPPQSLPYASAIPQRPYTGAQLPSNLPTSSHQMSSFGSEPSFGFVNTDQQVAGRFSAPATPQPFSSVGGGNPFG